MDKDTANSQSISQNGNASPLVSCMRSSSNSASSNGIIPQPLGAPPIAAARLNSLSNGKSATASAIPRPMSKRQILMMNGIVRDSEKSSDSDSSPDAKTPCSVGKPAEKMLARRNSSTNPFLCENSLDENVPPATIEIADETNINGNPFSTCALNKNESIQPKMFRNRSLSETESELKNLTNKISNNTSNLLKLQAGSNPFNGLKQKVKGPHMLQKTISEDFLFRKLGLNNSNTNINSNFNGANNTTGGSASASNGTWSFGRNLLTRQDSNFSLGRRNSSIFSLDLLGSLDNINLERTTSCDSVNSDSSVFVSNLDQPYTQITGSLCVGLNYDKNTITDEGLELQVSVLEAKNLICPFTVDTLDTLVRIYLVPDQAGAMQTQVSY